MSPNKGQRWSRIAPRGVLLEGAVVVGILAGAGLFGSWYALAQGQGPQGAYGFWAKYAVGAALGRGLAAPQEGKVAAFDAFLKKERAALSPAEIPRDARFAPIQPFAATHLYLIESCAWVWRLRGLSWESLGPVYGLFFAASCLAVYGIFRLAMNRMFALAGALVFALTPVHLMAIPHLRDYAKAPFILGLIFLLGLALRRRAPHSTLVSVLLGAACGVCIGVGLGMRQDLLVCLAPASAVLAVLLPGSIRKTWKQRIGALAALGVAFTLCAWPVLGAMARGGSNSGHNMLGGFAEDCAGATGYEEPGAQLQPVFLDSFIMQTVRAHARHAMGAGEPLPHLGPAYDAAAWDLILQYASVFPENLYLRGMAMLRATVMIVPLEFGWPGFAVTPLIQWIADHLLGWGYTATRAAPIALAGVSLFLLVRVPRVGLGVLFLLLFFGMYPALQYHPRHTFHLSFIGVWALLCTAQGLGSVLWRARRRVYRQQWHAARRVWRVQRPRLLASGAAVLLPAALLALLFAGASLVQRNRAAAVAAELMDAPRRPLVLEEGAVADGRPGWIALRPRDLFTPFSEEDRAWSFQRQYLAVEFRGFEGTFPVYVEYASEKPSDDFSFQTEVAVSAEETHSKLFFLPVYARTGTIAPDGSVKERSFTSIAVPAQVRTAIYQIFALERAPRLPLFSRLAAGTDAYAGTCGRVARYVPASWAVRGALAWRTNRIGDGSLEVWREERGAPDSCQPPAVASSIAPEREVVRHGNLAVKQVWKQPDAELHPLQQFGVYAGTLEPDREFDLCVEVSNQTSGTLGVAMWLVHAPEGKAPQVAPLNLSVLSIPPNRRYRLHCATFRTPPQLPPDTYLLFTTYARESVQPGEAAFWDAWRCSELPRL